jgi:tetratricopeptide (TPR) repeat protein
MLVLRASGTADFRMRWRWELTERRELTDGAGTFLADHEVRLCTGDWQYEAFADLHRHISWRADPGQRHDEDEARIVGEVRAWAREHLLGKGIADVLDQPRYRNAAVRVILPPGSENLAFLPLELAAPPGIALVIETGPADATPAPIGENLRVLGLFSLPEGGSPLNLRRERHQLVALIRGIAANTRAAEVKVLQYGVTRERLRDVLEDGDGWDLIHISGHGLPGELLLETPAGGPDRISADELARLLEDAAGRVKLVTVATCWSAARTASEQRRLLLLPVHEDQRGLPLERNAASRPTPAPGALATELSGRLRCAVLAMRYPVADDFAIELSAKLYHLLADKGQPLPQAVAKTLKHLMDTDTKSGRKHPALSIASPVLFGTTANGLTLKAPERTGPRSYSTDDLKIIGFPDEPDTFVGRTGVMARASAALAAESGVPGVLLHGMPGGGKTACALELAYGHEDTFADLAWYKIPDEGSVISGSLMGFALELEHRLDGFRMADVLTSETKLAAFLPRLTQLMKEKRLLLVIDNAESLLTSAGDWRDQQWGQVFGALTSHSGLGRVILTSRRVPADTRGLRVEAVDALTADEALLLARELPHLRALINNEVPGLDRDTSRNLALGVLNVAQGNPKLLELANGQAEHPEQLTALIQAGGDAWRDGGGLPEGFFGTGETTAAPDDYLRVLDTWVRSVTGALTSRERDVFHFFCCLEENDRERVPPLLEKIWPVLWEQLGRSGESPNLDQAAAAIAARGLAAIRAETGGKPASYGIHPAVAAAGRDHAGPSFRATIDFGLGIFWMTMFSAAAGTNDEHIVDTRMLVRSGLAGVPYLVRTEQWRIAGELLEEAFEQEPSRASAVAFLPAAVLIASHDPRYEGALAMILREVDLFDAEYQLRDSLTAASARRDYRTAWRAAGRLADLCRETGRRDEARELAGRMAAYIRQDELGPWVQLFGQVKRLQVLIDDGQAGQVRDDVQQLRALVETLPERVGVSEEIPPWKVREALLDTGRSAASYLGHWQDALHFNSEITASLHARNAPDTQIARARYNDHEPLLRLGRTDEAFALLQDCRKAFPDTDDLSMLAKILAALSETEYRRGHDETAIQLERDARRYASLAADPYVIMLSYYSLTDNLPLTDPQALAIVLFTMIICILTGLDPTGGLPRLQAEDIFNECRRQGIAPTRPASITDLSCRLDDLYLPGSDPAGLIARLSPDSDTAERILQAIIEELWQ